MPKDSGGGTGSASAGPGVPLILGMNQNQGTALVIKDNSLSNSYNGTLKGEAVLASSEINSREEDDKSRRSRFPIKDGNFV